MPKFSIRHATLILAQEIRFISYLTRKSFVKALIARTAVININVAELYCSSSLMPKQENFVTSLENTNTGNETEQMKFDWVCLAIVLKLVKLG